jgi:nucleotide-binding universal stress UspA family protein
MRPPFRSILCPTDLSPVGNGAVEVAFRLVAPEGTVHLLHVNEPFRAAPDVSTFAATVREHRFESEAERRALQDLVPERVPPGVRTRCHVVEGADVPGVIEDQARRHGADVVVMATQGRTGLGRLVMGSVAADVIKKLELPVILVRRAD